MTQRRLHNGTLNIGETAGLVSPMSLLETNAHLSLPLLCSTCRVLTSLSFLLLLQLEDKKESEPEVSISSMNGSGKKERVRLMDTFRG